MKSFLSHQACSITLFLICFFLKTISLNAAEYSKTDLHQLQFCSMKLAKKRLQSAQLVEYQKRFSQDSSLTQIELCKEIISDSFSMTKKDDNYLITILNSNVYLSLKHIFLGMFKTKDFVSPHNPSQNYKKYNIDELADILIFHMLKGDQFESILKGRVQVVYDSGKFGSYTVTESKEEFVSVDFKNISERINRFEHLGGGIVGHPLYLLLSLGIPNNFSQDGMYISRFWPISVLSDFLCLDLPNLETEDVQGLVNPNSELAFHRSADCMRCHATIDPLSSAVRNLAEVTVKTDKADVTTAIYKYKPTLLEEPVFFVKSNAYHLYLPIGALSYRLKDEKYSMPFSSFAELGALLSSRENYLKCLQRKLMTSIGSKIQSYPSNGTIIDNLTYYMGTTTRE